MYRIFIAIFFLVFFLTKGQTQEISYGFKIGLNVSKINGDAEQSPDGNDLETFDTRTGFQIGGLCNFKINDRFGARAELLFSQKGGRNVFESDNAYIAVPTISGELLRTSGTKKIILNTTNTYLDLPLIVYGKFGRIEVNGGVNIGLLTTSKAIGEISYSNTAALAEKLIIELEHNYYKDEAGEVLETSPSTISFNGIAKDVSNQFNAYYLFSEKDKSFYNLIDIGINFGLSYYFNDNLFLGYRANIGLSDVTNSDYDISRVSLDGTNFINRSDSDKNLSHQFTIGFSF